VDEGEIRALKNFNAGVAHNPSSNLKLAAGVAPVAKMLELGVNVGIGTDGAASNNDLDMFEETRLAALLAKGINGDPTAVPAREALAMATRLGAAALHLGHLTGSLEAGKRADLIVLDASRLHHVPAFARDPAAIYARIVYTAKSTDVVDVLCDGRWLMQDRELKTVDEDEVMREAAERAHRIDAFLSGREGSVLQKLVAVGGAVEQESFEVQVKARLETDSRVLEVLEGRELTVIRRSRYRQHDLYWSFDDPDQGRLRHRADEFLDEMVEGFVAASGRWVRAVPGGVVRSTRSPEPCGCRECGQVMRPARTRARGRRAGRVGGDGWSRPRAVECGRRAGAD